MSTADYGAYRAANDAFDDRAGLEQRFADDGYLLLRGVIDAALVARAKAEFVAMLQRQGFVAAGQAEPVWTGRSPELLDDDAFYALDSYQQLCRAPSTRALFERILGGPVHVFRNIVLRFAFPHDEARLTCAHQDGYFYDGPPGFRTFWIPLMDIDRTVGGLALAAGSHRAGGLAHRYMNAVGTGFKGRKRRGVEPEQFSGAPLCGEFHAGDVVIFHGHTVHWAVLNRSPLIRLSLDARAQPAALARSWESLHTVPEARRARAQLRELATAQGATDQAFEAVADRVFREGHAIDPAVIARLLAEAEAVR
jgi:ectoine hydroxylase-related dioxygenase (phytanoyl-CoA dioxygenase family)